jgi:hypothetical protein
MRLPTPSLKTLGKVAVGGTVVGVGAAALTGSLPGTQSVPGGIGSAASGFANGIGDVWNGATSGLAGILQMGPLLLVGGGAVLLLVLLK